MNGTSVDESDKVWFTNNMGWSDDTSDVSVDVSDLRKLFTNLFAMEVNFNTLWITFCDLDVDDGFILSCIVDVEVDWVASIGKTAFDERISFSFIALEEGATGNLFRNFRNNDRDDSDFEGNAEDNSDTEDTGLYS